MPNFEQESTFAGVPTETVSKVLADMKPPTDADFEKEAQRQRKEFGKSFDEVYNTNNVTAGTRRMLENQKKEHNKMNRIGWKPVTIINLMPFTLDVNGVIQKRYDLRVPPAPAEPLKKGAIPYSRRVLDRIYWDSEDQGSDMEGVDNFKPVPWLPIEVAEDFTREYNDIQNCGGVFIYEGDHLPETSPVLMNQLKRAQEELFKWCEKKVQDADLEFASESTRKNISDVHRNAWKIMFRAGLTSEEQKPAWLHSVHSSARQAPEFCPGCDKPKAGAVCVNCGNVFKPLVAYKESMIEFGHVSFGKMNDEEFKEALKWKAHNDKRFAAIAKAKGE